MGKQRKHWQTLFSWAPKSLQMVTAAMKLKELAPWKKRYYQPRQHINKQRHYFANKGPYRQSCGFSSSQVEMWELDHKESWVPKNWCFLTVVLEKTLESPLDCKEITPVCPKGNQAWIFTGMTDGEAEAPIFWPPDVKSWLIRKDSDAGEDWRQEEMGMTKDEMVGWHQWLNGREFEHTPGDGEEQGSLVCCSQWGHKESDTEQPNNWRVKMLVESRGWSPARLESKQGKDLSRIFNSTMGFTDQSLPCPATGLEKKKGTLTSDLQAGAKKSMRTGLVFLSTATSWTPGTRRAGPADGRFHISAGHLDIQPGWTLSFPSKAHSCGPGKDTFAKPNTFTFFSPFYFDSCLNLGLFSPILFTERIMEVLEMVEG